MFIFSVTSPSATYTITPTPSAVDEGAQITISLQTTGVQMNQAIPFLIVGDGITLEDFNGLLSLSGEFVVDINGQASITLNVSEDAITEGLETFDIMLFNGTRISVNVNDTSGASVSSLYIGGMFTSYNGTSSSKIARLNANGSYDSTFNIGTGFNNDVLSVAVQSDGKIVCGGTFTSYNGTSSSKIARLNVDGSYDSTFNVGTGFNNTVYSIAVQSDGKIVCGGALSSYRGITRNRIARLNVDGSYDSTFNIGTGFVGIVSSVAVQSDGKIVCGGYFTSYNGTSSSKIARLNANGSYDSTFNVGTGFNNTVYSIAVQSDGKIVCGGYFTSYNGTSSNTIARLNANGSYDSTFNVGTGFNNDVQPVAIQSDGKIMCGGSFASYNGTSSNRIARLNTDGSYDSTFNIGTGFDDLVLSVAVQSDGKIVCGGHYVTYQGAARGRIVRLNADGSYDSSFNIGTGFDNIVYTIAF